MAPRLLPSLSLVAVVLMPPLLLAQSGALQGAKRAEGPPFPRIANVYGVALTPEGPRVFGQAHSLEEVARCDLLIGVRAGGGSEDFPDRLGSI